VQVDHLPPVQLHSEEFFAQLRKIANAPEHGTWCVKRRKCRPWIDVDEAESLYCNEDNDDDSSNESDGEGEATGCVVC